MIRVTRWSPDTCGCEIEYEWDDAVPQETRVHTGSRVVRSCAAHDGSKGDPRAHHSVVLEENQRKNRAHAVIQETLGREVEMRFRFDANRKLLAAVPGASAAELARLRGAVEQAGKVEIE